VSVIDISDWYTSITIKSPGTKDKYGQYTTTSSTIQGRLNICTAKLFTASNLNLDTLVTSDKDYKIVQKKACKNKDNIIEFYKYLLV
jgi:hypothetical protein